MKNTNLIKMVIAGMKFSVARAAVCMVALMSLFTCESARAAIAQRGTATTANNNANNSTTITLNKPTGVVQGDVMIACITKSGANGSADPSLSGWTLLRSAGLTGQSGQAGRGTILYKVATASEGTSYTFALNGAGTPVSSIGAIVAFSGVDTNSGPFDVATSNIAVSSSSTATAVNGTNTTVVTANSAVLMFGMGNSPNSAGSWSAWNTTSPGTLTQLFSITTGSGVDNRVTVGSAWAIKSTTGNTGNGTATYSVGCRNGGVLVILRPMPIPANATNSMVSANPTNVLADGVSASTVTVTVEDNSGTPLSGKTVTLASSRGTNDTISAASGPSDASGIVTFTVSSATTGTSVYTATVVTDGIVVTQTASVTYMVFPIMQRGAAMIGTTTSTSLTINKPVGVVQGDIMLVGIAQYASLNTITASGWTLIDARSIQGTGSTARYAGLFYKVAGASEGSSYTFTLGAGTTSGAGGIVAFSGVDTTGGYQVGGGTGGPFDVMPGIIYQATGANSTSVSANSITTETANAAVIMFGMAAGGNPTWSGWTTTSPGTLTEVYDTQDTMATAGAAWGTKTTAGATGAGAATLSVAHRNGGILVALRPMTSSTPANATNSTVTAFPTDVPADGVSTSQVTVTLEDNSGLPVPGKTVSLASSRGTNDTISAASGPSDASGIVTFSVKSMQPGSSLYTATDVTDSVVITQKATVTFAALPASATNSTVTASPTSVPADGVSTSTVTVTLKNFINQPVTGKAVTLVSNRDGADTISAASGPSDASGVVTFVVKSATPGVSYFAASNVTEGIALTQTAAVTFTTLPASATNSTVTAFPTTVPADGVSTSTITVTLIDILNQAVTGKTVTLKSSRGATDTISTASGPSDASGIVTFSVKSSTPGSPYFTASNVTDNITISQTATVAFVVQTADATNSTVTAFPTNVPANGISTAQVSVTLKDINNLPVVGKTVTLASSRGGTDTISPASGPSDSSGIVTFGVKSSTPGSPVFTATNVTDGIEIIQTATVTFYVQIADASNSTVKAFPSSVPADGISTSTVTVTLKDGNNASVAGKTVSLSSDRGTNDVISAASGPSDASGIVRFTVKSLLQGSPLFTATDVTDSVIITQKATVTFTSLPASATNSTVSANPTSVPADGVSTSTVTVTLMDIFNQVVTGKTVALISSRGASDTISAASGPSDASGVVMFSVKSTNAGSPYFTASNVTDSIKISQTATVTFTTLPASATNSTVTANPTNLPADGISTSIVTVTLKNVLNQPVTGKTVTLVSSRGASETISAASGPSDASGIVTFGVKSSTPGSPYFTASNVTDSIKISQTATVTFAASTNKDILTFTFPTYGAATIVGTNISITVPVGTPVTNMSPTYTVSSLATGAPPSGTSRDFTTPKTYTVTAQDLSTKIYQVTVNVAIGSMAKDILTFGTNYAGSSAIISTSAATVAWSVPFGTDVTTLAPAYTVSALATGSPPSGTARNFSSPQTYTITAQDLSTTNYIVTVTMLPGSPLKDILTFGTNYAGSTAVINTNTDTITWTLAAGTSLTNLAPAYTVSSNASGSPVSGTARNFTTPQTYIITAQDGSTVPYVVNAYVAGAQGYGIALATDVAQEFSPFNRSGHPIFTGLDNYSNSVAVGSPSRRGLQPAALKAPWNVNVGQQTMMCSDCHNTDNATTAAQGPHGSAYQFMLRGPNATNWPTGTTTAFANSWCANCHNNAAGEPHTRSDHSGQQCYRCHTLIPHGGGMSRLLGDRDGAMPARYAFNNTLTNILVYSFTKTSTNGYSSGNCRANCNSHTASSSATMENW